MFRLVSDHLGISAFECCPEEDESLLDDDDGELDCVIVPEPPFDKDCKLMPNWSKLTPRAIRIAAAMGI